MRQNKVKCSFRWKEKGNGEEVLFGENNGWKFSRSDEREEARVRVFAIEMYTLKMKPSPGPISLAPNPKCLRKCGFTGSGFYLPGNFVNHFKTVSMLFSKCFVLLCLQISDVDSMMKALSQSPSWVSRARHRGPREISSPSESLGAM